jgi:hypothetical protein
MLTITRIWLYSEYWIEVPFPHVLLEVELLMSILWLIFHKTYKPKELEEEGEGAGAGDKTTTWERARKSPVAETAYG